MGNDYSKGSRSEKKKKKQKSLKESTRKDITSSALQEMENGDMEQEGRRLFLDDQVRRKEKSKELLKDFSKLKIKPDQVAVEAEKQQPRYSRYSSLPGTQGTANLFVNQDFGTNLNSTHAAQDGSESKLQNESSPNDSLDNLQHVDHVLLSTSQCPERGTDGVCSHASVFKTMTSETMPDSEQAMISRNVLGNIPQVIQNNTPPRGPSQTGTDLCSVTEPELNHNNTSGGTQSRIHDSNSSHINGPSGCKQELDLAETAPLVYQSTVNRPVQTDPGLLPNRAPEDVSGRSIEDISSRDQGTTTSATRVPDSVTQHRIMATESSSKKPSTGDDFSNNTGQMDSPDGVPQEHSEYILDSSSYPSIPPTPASKPESTTPSAMQIVGPGLNQKEDIKKLTVDDQLISKAVTENTLLLEKLSKYLDRESRVIKCWKHLAFVLNVPAEETRKFDTYTEHSPTEDMFIYLADIWNPDLKVKELKMKLKTIYRNDVIDSLTKDGYHDEMKVGDLMSGQPKFIPMLSSKLDKESRTIGNWKSLATQFGIRKQKTEQFGLRGSGPTAALFLHMSTADGLKDLTMGELREHFTAMERKDLVNILRKHNCEDSSLVRTIATNGSEVLADIEERLNKEMRAVKNWRNLAYRLNIPREEYDAFDTSKGAAKSPTKMLFEWLQSSKPNVTVKDLLNGLKQIDRYDVVDLVREEVTTAMNLKKHETDSRRGCSDLMQVDGISCQLTAKQALWKIQQLHHYPDKGHKKTDLLTDLERRAAALGLKIVDSKGKGNCMFSALSRQLEIKTEWRYSERELRTELVQYLTDHPTFGDDTGSLLNLFDFVDERNVYPTWQDYLEKMAEDGNWGDHIILKAAARNFNCVVHVISSRPGGDAKIKPDSTTCNVAELVLGHIHEYHYVSLEPDTVDVPVSSYPCPVSKTNWQLPFSKYAGHPPHATNSQQSQGPHQSGRYSKEEKESMKVRLLPFSVYPKICIKLNIRRDWSFDDFRMVAEQLGMDRDTTEFIGQQTNPTHCIFTEYYPNVTVLQLINILHKIKRIDVAAVLEEWSKDAQ